MRPRLTTTLPAFALVVFATQSYFSWREQAQIGHHNEAACFWWSNLPLDSKPLEKTAAFPGHPSVTQCGFEIQVIDREGPRWPIRLFILSGLPAFLAAFSLAHVLGNYGVSEVRTFMVSAPLLIALWFYGVARLIQHWRKRAETRRQRSARAELTTGH